MVLAPEEMQKVHQLIHRQGKTTRFTQDSPILADVWCEFAERPNETVDLLLSPHAQSDAVELCGALLDRLRRERKSDFWKQRHLTSKKDSAADSNPDLIYNESHVVVRLSFDELMRVALPLTNWWQQYVMKRADQMQLDDLQSPEVQKKLAELLERASVEDAMVDDSVSHVLWIVRLVGYIEWRRLQLTSRRKKKQPSNSDLVKVFCKLMEGTQSDNLPSKPLLWAVNHNRRIELTVQRSVSSVKADAASRLFSISCKSLSWAVIDSGIDATHPAFRQRDANNKMVSRQPFESPTRSGNQTRVKATFDFTRLREYLQIPIDGAAVIDRRVKKFTDGLRSGRMLDWNFVKTILRIPHTADDYKVPQHEHGTHVAGILGAMWCEGDDPGPDRTDVMRGMCPDLNLYDLRVLDENGKGWEDAVLAALQYVRYLNASKDVPVIHGVNISMSLKHKAEIFACGRTPICDECERLIASGVVVVAAAGNEGRTLYQSDQGTSEGYRGISITDPGNAESVITVGSTHRFKPHSYGVSYFSSRGPTGDGRRKPDLVAPGEKIKAPIPGNRAATFDGTSQAAPHVGGAAAMLMARHTELIGQPNRVKQILCQTATDLGREPNFQGHGLVDVLRAIQSV